jgi:hypothetical protein
MTKALILAAAALSVSLGAGLTAAQADEADWKRGRIYYRAVCTACHAGQPIGQIAPSAYTKADWATYLKADKHAKGKEPVSKFWSTAYRTEVKATNKAAERFLPIAEAQLAADLYLFLEKGAKDGDSPASCN